ncbi:UvrD-helicase domain-containing protein [Phytomonospora sp. NPDC050363]|uniref:UvrD-helicase domain-containing protein n=1 Tax=Phytomonospora sp. NPDC050363 TaxID=3155642 RepID=UPI0033D24CF7
MEPVAAGTNEPDGLFALPEGARVVRRRRSPARRSRPEITYAPVPDPVLMPQRSVAAPVGPPLSGMEEVGTGLLDRLDMMQRVAASAPPGPLLINAGPGTGKTHTLTHRIAYLIADLDVPARECVAVTRSPRAAAELRTRLAALLGERAKEVTAAPLGALAGAEPWRHLFVDDLHDFTEAEYGQLRELGGDGQLVSATGDADQTLTEGQPDLLERFTTEHTDTRVFRLTRNYRSLETILATAGLLVSPVAVARSRLLQPVRRETPASPPVQRYAAADEAEEAGVVADIVTRLSRLGVPAPEIGVLWFGDPKQITGATSLRLADAVGREFRVVIVPGVDAEAVPVDTANRRRLFVALTRARDLAYLTHVGNPSPLLSEMHSGLVRVYGHVPDEQAKGEQPRLL